MSVKRWSPAEWAMAKADLDEQREALSIIERWIGDMGLRPEDEADKVSRFFASMMRQHDALEVAYEKRKPRRPKNSKPRA